jgi:multiple sugar transport system substrate-binding protein
MRLRRGLATALLASMALFAAACGGDDDEGNGGTSAGSGAAESTGATEGAKAAPALDAAKSAKGNVTYCTGKDTSGAQKESVKLFNEKFASQGLKAKLLEFPESADEQRNQFIQRQEAKSGECDIFYSDVIWTAEFASQKWLMDLSEYVNARKGEFIPSTLETIKFDGDKYWGVPKQTDAGFIYYRTDQVDGVPATWQAVYEEAQKNKGIVYQGAAYEGLTVDYLELAFAAGGKVLSDDGKKSEINSPANVKALQFMVDGIKDGAAPKAVTTYMEEPARRAFEAGRATFMRNWPYAYALGQKADKIKGKFKVAPYPEFEGGGKAGILGGHNLVISAFSKNPEGAVALIDYLTAPEAIARDAAEYSLAPVLTETYEDADVKKALPFSDELKQAVAQAKPRPISPVYTQISSAIYKNVNTALSGQQAPAAALKKADEEITKALQTF